MPRPDTGTFNRLLTSVGLIFMAAALVIPYFYFQSNDTLMVEQRQLDRLTETARTSIEDRQDDVASVQPYILPGAGVLILVGLGFLVWGGYRLRSTQERDDREAEARTVRAEAGVRDLTPKEKEEKIAEDVTRPPSGPPGEATKDAPMEAPLGHRESRRVTREQRLKAARRVEQKITSAFAQAELDGYLFRPQVAVGKLKLDGLFISVSEGQSDVLLEVRVGPTGPATILFVDQILARVVRYEAERKRRCRPWLVVVLPDTDSNSEEIDAIYQRLERNLGDIGAATVVLESEISMLPIAFENIRRSSGLDPRDKRNPAD